MVLSAAAGCAHSTNRLYSEPGTPSNLASGKSARLRTCLNKAVDDRVYRRVSGVHNALIPSS